MVTGNRCIFVHAQVCLCVCARGNVAYVCACHLAEAH